MFVVAAILATAQAAAVFAPPLGVPVRVESVRTQLDPPEREIFTITRVIRFAREPGGYRAELLLLAARAEGPAAVSAMYEAGYSGLEGRTIVFHLDSTGHIVSVEDRAALWERFCVALAEIVAARHKGDPAERKRLVEQLEVPFRAFSEERQTAALASLIDVAIAHDPAEPPGSRAVQIPARSPYGAPVTLDGTRTVADAAGLLRITMRAAGDVPGGHVEMQAERDVDPLTGLFASSSETVATRVGEGPAARTSERTTTLRITTGAN